MTARYLFEKVRMLEQGKPEKLMKRVIFLIVVVVVLAPVPGLGKGPRVYENCSVKEVVDGDTITAKCGRRTRKVRLVAVDTPESQERGGKRRFERLLRKKKLPANWGKNWEEHKALGLKCKDITTKFLEGHKFKVIAHGEDQSGRKIADVVRESDGKSLVERLYHEPEVQFYEGNSRDYVLPYRRKFVQTRTEMNPNLEVVVKRIERSDLFVVRTKSGKYVRVPVAGVKGNYKTDDSGKMIDGFNEVKARKELTAQFVGKRIGYCADSQCSQGPPPVLNPRPGKLYFLGTGETIAEWGLGYGLWHLDRDAAKKLVEGKWLRKAHKAAKKALAGVHYEKTYLKEKKEEERRLAREEERRKRAEEKAGKEAERAARRSRCDDDGDSGGGGGGTTWRDGHWMKTKSGKKVWRKGHRMKLPSRRGRGRTPKLW